MTHPLRLATLALAFLAAACNGASKPNQAMKRILVPKQDIPQGLKLDVDTMFSFKEFLAGTVPLNAIDDPAKLNGKVPVRILFAGLPVTDRDLSPNKSVAREMEPGYRALTILAEYHGMGMILPGNHLNIFAVVPDPDNPGKSISSIFATNVKVLAVNTMPRVNKDQQPTSLAPLEFTFMVKPDVYERGESLKKHSRFLVTFVKPNHRWAPAPKQDIPAGTTLDERRMFSPNSFDADTMPANAMTFNQLNGRIAARRLAAGKLVTESDLIEPAVQAQLQPGYRAVAMRARSDDPAFAKTLQVGTRVDVRVTVPYVDKPTSIVMRGLQVLAVQKPEKDTDIVKITLMVTPDQAKSLLLAPSSETPKLLPHRPEPATKED